ncbi:sensor histidine kinase [Tellurirhabdus rosea]|uniref:sensor histidine kinase n=1 Tax=Tellurirhabdus rosea TaxID=2674997 RepID=UPI002259E54A|nr:histidine kinase [Tellurirhabdus rosea]
MQSPLTTSYRISSWSKWNFLLLFPWFMPLITYLLLGPVYFSDAGTFVGATLLNVSIGCLCILTLDYLTFRVMQQFPSLPETPQRAFSLLLVYMVVTPVFILGPIWMYGHFHLFGYTHDPAPVSKILLVNLVANLVSVGAFESSYSMAKWEEGIREEEQLRKTELQNQFENLKNQVNPHFLFNSLNSLSSLISDEPQQAEQFVNELSKVYRYLLQTNERELTTLQAEMTFIGSYVHLLQTRHGQGLHLEATLDKCLEQHRLPPLTLQLLVENAVKHNVIQAGKPLKVQIQTTPDQRLLVRNTIRRKTIRVVSNHVGLNNIAAKYRLLAQSDIDVQDDGETFTVTVPLLKPLSE